MNTVENATILSSEVASQIDTNASQRSCSFKSSFSMANKRLPLALAESHLEDVGRSGSYSDSDIRYVPAALNHMNDFLHSSCLHNGHNPKSKIVFIFCLY